MIKPNYSSGCEGSHGISSSLAMMGDIRSRVQDHTNWRLDYEQRPTLTLVIHRTKKFVHSILAPSSPFTCNMSCLEFKIASYKKLRGT